MNEVIAQLKDVSQDVSCPLELPEEDDLVVIEEEILISIPSDLREYLLEASDVVYGALEPVTIADPNAHTHLPEVTAEAWDRGLPREYIPFCAYRDGFYFIAEDGEVGYWAPDVNLEESEDHWQNLWDWIEDVWLNS